MAIVKLILNSKDVSRINYFNEIWRLESRFFINGCKHWPTQAEREVIAKSVGYDGDALGRI